MNMVGSLLGSGDKILDDVDEKKQGMSFDLNSVMQNPGGGGGLKGTPPSSLDPNAKRPSVNDFMKFLNF